MTYSIAGDPGITQYFMVDQNTGDVSLKKSLQIDPNLALVYQVFGISRISALCRQIGTSIHIK